jgi:hypothetical protein
LGNIYNLYLPVRSWMRRKRSRMKKDNTNEKTWNYAIGIVQVEGIKPSDDFLALAEKEKRGELTNEDIRRVLVKNIR